MLESGVGSRIDRVIFNIKKEEDISSLNFSDFRLSEEDMTKLVNELARNSNIVELNLENCGITDQMCAAIGALLVANKSLLRLNLRGNEFTDEGMLQICNGLQENKTLLEVFFCNNKNLTDKSFDRLNALLKINPSLTTLFIANIHNRKITLSADALTQNYAILFVVTLNRDEEVGLQKSATTRNYKMFSQITKLLVSNNIGGLRTDLENIEKRQYFKLGGMNAIKYFLTDDGGEYKFSINHAHEYLRRLVDIIEAVENNLSLMTKLSLGLRNYSTYQLTSSAMPISASHRISEVVLPSKKRKAQDMVDYQQGGRVGKY